MNEGDSGSQTYTLRATLNRVATSTVTVNLSIDTSGTCTADFSDYSVSSPITININESQATSNLTVYGDTTVEDNETACIGIDNVTNASENGTQQVSVTIVNDDAPPVAVTNFTATSGQNRITLNWDALSGADNYTIYWKTSSGVTVGDSSFSGIDNTTYVHGGLDSSQTYYYNIMPYGSSITGILATEVSASPSAWSCASTSGVLPDNDPDLLVYYPFNNNLNDNKSTFHLSNVGGTMKFDDGCGYGLSGYFDSTSGYAENRNFRDNDSTVGSRLAAGDFTITMWVNADQDMPKFASALNTGFKQDMQPTDWQNKSQIDIDGDGAIRWLTTDNVSNVARSIADSAAFTLHKWHHLAAVHYDNDTAELYSLGKLVGSNTNFPAKWYGLVVGLNRAKTVESSLWKGYIDEVKVYGRAFTEQEVVSSCSVYAECHIPTNLTVTAGQEQNVLTWDAVSGASGYKVYRSTSPGVTTSSTLLGSLATTTLTEPSLTGGTTYYYRVLSVKGGQESALSVEKSGTPLGLPANWATAGLSATSNESQQVTLTWSGVAGADNYTVYWDNVSFSDNNSRNRIEKVLGSSSGSICNSGTCSYI
ncbi:MAG: LamG-like jellyroll fold domain-containing protein, partial [SAR324 cluster bacterium]|nr:LamG-like jellyroll fold domain-containing protein [SAR324 cluster bacterium]